jgi:hypothetical protein
MKENEASPLFGELLKLYGPILSLQEAAKVLKYPSVKAIRTAFHAGRLPVQLRDVGGRQAFFLGDIVEFLTTGKKQDQVLKPRKLAPPVRTGKKVGRPTKAEQIARRASEGRA